MYINLKILKIMKTLLERITANADELRLARATNSVEMAAEASRAQIAKWRSTFLSRLNDLENLLDLGDTSTTDIAHTLKDFNPEKWAEKIHEDIIPDIMTRYERLQARIRFHNALFPNHIIPETDSVIHSSEICKIIMGITEEKKSPVVKKVK